MQTLSAQQTLRSHQRANSLQPPASSQSIKPPQPVSPPEANRDDLAPKAGRAAEPSRLSLSVSTGEQHRDTFEAFCAHRQERGKLLPFGTLKNLPIKVQFTVVNGGGEEVAKLNPILLRPREILVQEGCKGWKRLCDIVPAVKTEQHHLLDQTTLVPLGQDGNLDLIPANHKPMQLAVCPCSGLMTASVTLSPTELPLETHCHLNTDLYLWVSSLRDQLNVSDGTPWAIETDNGTSLPVGATAGAVATTDSDTVVEFDVCVYDGLSFSDPTMSTVNHSQRCSLAESPLPWSDSHREYRFYWAAVAAEELESFLPESLIPIPDLDREYPREGMVLSACRLHEIVLKTPIDESTIMAHALMLMHDFAELCPDHVQLDAVLACDGTQMESDLPLGFIVDVPGPLTLEWTSQVVGGDAAKLPPTAAPSLVAASEPVGQDVDGSSAVTYGATASPTPSAVSTTAPWSSAVVSGGSKGGVPLQRQAATVDINAASTPIESLEELARLSASFKSGRLVSCKLRLVEKSAFNQGGTVWKCSFQDLDPGKKPLHVSGMLDCAKLDKRSLEYWDWMQLQPNQITLGAKCQYLRESLHVLQFLDHYNLEAERPRLSLFDKTNSHKRQDILHHQGKECICARQVFDSTWGCDLLRPFYVMGPLDEGETDHVEFKDRKLGRNLVMELTKTLTAMLNIGASGRIVLGVKEDRKQPPVVVGLKNSNSLTVATCADQLGGFVRDLQRYIESNVCQWYPRMGTVNLFSVPYPVVHVVGVPVRKSQADPTIVDYVAELHVCIQDAQRPALYSVGHKEHMVFHERRYDHTITHKKDEAKIRMMEIIEGIPRQDMAREEQNRVVALEKLCSLRGRKEKRAPDAALIKAILPFARDCLHILMLTAVELDPTEWDSLLQMPWGVVVVVDAMRDGDADAAQADSRPSFISSLKKQQQAILGRACFTLTADTLSAERHRISKLDLQSQLLVFDHKVDGRPLQFLKRLLFDVAKKGLGVGNMQVVSIWDREIPRFSNDLSDPACVLIKSHEYLLNHLSVNDGWESRTSITPIRFGSDPMQCLSNSFQNLVNEHGDQAIQMPVLSSMAVVAAALQAQSPSPATLKTTSNLYRVAHRLPNTDRPSLVQFEAGRCSAFSDLLTIVLHQELNPNHPSFRFSSEGLAAEEALRFYRGGEVTWGNLYLHHDIERTSCLMNSLRDRTFDIAGLCADLDATMATSEESVSVTILYTPGSGGSTVLRRIAYDLSQRCRVLCVTPKAVQDGLVDQVAEALVSIDGMSTPLPDAEHLHPDTGANRPGDVWVALVVEDGGDVNSRDSFVSRLSAKLYLAKKRRRLLTICLVPVGGERRGFRSTSKARCLILRPFLDPEESRKLKTVLKTSANIPWALPGADFDHFWPFGIWAFAGDYQRLKHGVEQAIAAVRDPGLPAALSKLFSVSLQLVFFLYYFCGKLTLPLEMLLAALHDYVAEADLLGRYMLVGNGSRDEQTTLPLCAQRLLQCNAKGYVTRPLHGKLCEALFEMWSEDGNQVAFTLSCSDVMIDCLLNLLEYNSVEAPDDLQVITDAIVTMVGSSSATDTSPAVLEDNMRFGKWFGNLDLKSSNELPLRLLQKLSDGVCAIILRLARDHRSEGTHAAFVHAKEHWPKLHGLYIHCRIRHCRLLVDEYRDHKGAMDVINRVLELDGENKLAFVTRGLVFRRMFSSLTTSWDTSQQLCEVDAGVANNLRREVDRLWRSAEADYKAALRLQADTFAWFGEALIHHHYLRFRRNAEFAGSGIDLVDALSRSSDKLERSVVVRLMWLWEQLSGTSRSATHVYESVAQKAPQVYTLVSRKEGLRLAESHIDNSQRYDASQGRVLWVRMLLYHPDTRSYYRVPGHLRHFDAAISYLRPEDARKAMKNLFHNLDNLALDVPMFQLRWQLVTCLKLVSEYNPPYPSVIPGRLILFVRDWLKASYSENPATSLEACFWQVKASLRLMLAGLAASGVVQVWHRQPRVPTA